MPLLNYTTSISVDRSVEDVRRLLGKAGAKSVNVEYSDDRPVAMTFRVPTAYGPRTFALPVDAERVRAVLQRHRVDPRYRTLSHAERVAWRIVKDWIEAQLAILQTEMVSLDQVMLPYMVGGEGGQSLYELYVAEQPALPGKVAP